MFSKLKADINAALKNDPAARSKAQIFFTYTGVKALLSHRRANFFYRHHMKIIADFIAYRCKKKFGIDIHPAAKIAPGVFIDHGVGVVIGETCEIETDVVIYQGVTLGGTGKEHNKRHPTIKRGCVISAGAKILGSFTVGENSKIGAGSVVLQEIPPNSTVVGVPGHVVKIDGKKLYKNVDPIAFEICKLREEVYLLKQEVFKDNKDENI